MPSSIVLPPAAEVLIVGASRGAADDFAREVGRARGATFGLYRFSLTELAARAAAALASRRAATPGSAGAEALAARAVFDALRCRRARLLRAGRRDARFSAGARADRSRAAPRGRRPAALARARRRRRADVGRLLARIEEQLAGVGRGRSRRALQRRDGGVPRGRRALGRLPMLLLDVPLDSRASRRSAAALVARARRCWRPCRTATSSRSRRLRRSASRSKSVDDDAAAASRSAASAPLRVHAPIAGGARTRAGDVALFSAPGEGREARRDRAARAATKRERGVPFDEMAIFLRAPQQYLGPARARVRARRRARLFRSRHAPPGSGRSRVRRAAVVRGRGTVGASASTSTCRSVRCRRSAIAAPPSSTRRRRGDDVFAEHRIGADECRRADGDDGHEDAPDSDDERSSPARLRSPWKWEELIVESAVVGGRTRADGKRGGAAAGRARRRTTAAVARAGADEPDSPRIARFARDLRNLDAPACVRAADHRRARGVADAGDVGRVARSRLRRSRRACFAVRRACCDAGGSAADGGRRARSASKRRATCCTTRLVTLDWEPPARRYGRVFVGTSHQVRGRASASCSCRGSPSGSFRSGRARIRCCSTSGAARSTRRSSTQERAQRGGTTAAEARDRRGDRAAVSLVSAPRRRGDAPARAVVLRARRDARDHRARAGSPRAGRRRRRGRRREPRVAGAARSATGRSTISSTISRR